MRSLAAASVPLTGKGRYRSGQTGQTVNLLALRLRWFESSPAQCLAAGLICELVSGLFAGHLRGDHRIRRRRNRVRRRRAAVVLAGELHSRSTAGLRWPGH
jgi:hypothetical protein